MADDSRSPGICPGDPGEACKVGIRACLPPRKRLLAGLKQSGLLSSSSYLQSRNGASCAGLMEELKLEVDLAEANLESNADTNAVENSVSVKNKKASRRRKRLSVLTDRHGSISKSPPEALKSSSGGKPEKKFRTNKVCIETSVTSNGEKESDPSYKEMVDAARAAAAIAAEARAIALDKAAAAAKAAAVAKAALEVLALASYDDEEWGLPSRKHIRALSKHKRKGDKLKQELKREAVLLTEGVDALPEKKEEDERMHVCSVPLDRSKEDEQSQISHVALPPVCMSDRWDQIKEDKRTESEKFLIVDLASAPSDKTKEDEQAHLHRVYTVACPPPPPLDDEKLARQLHRVMNSSPRISRYRAPLECSKKRETAVISTHGCIQNKCLRAGGYKFSREKKPIHKEKTRISRTSSGRADVKVRSMSAINETLNMLQGTSPSQSSVLGGMVSCCAAAEEHADNVYGKEDLFMPTISAHAVAALTKSNEDGDKLAVGGDGASTCVFDVQVRNQKPSLSTYPEEPGVVGADDESRAIKWAETIKKQKSSSKSRTGGSFATVSPGRFQFSSQTRDSNGICGVPGMSSTNNSATFCNAVSELTVSHFESSKDNARVSRDENIGRLNVSGLGPTVQVAGESVKEMSTDKNTQENSFRDKSSKATRISTPISSHGERHTRRQKVLGVLSNGLSKGNQNFGGNLNISSYMPSPTVS